MSVISSKFILKISLFTLLIFACATGLFSTVLKRYYLESYPYLILLVATVTTVGHLWIIKASSANAMKFTTTFMASVTLKLMVYLFFMLVYLIFDRSQVIPFILTFIALYILFTIFEVIQVLNFIKNNQKRSI
jgi:hypothetical protein